MTHIVESCRFAGQEPGRLNGTLAKNGAGVSRMADLHHLVRTGKNHIVDSHNGSAPDSGYSNLVGRSLFPSLAAVLNIIITLVSRLIDGIS